MDVLLIRELVVALADDWDNIFDSETGQELASPTRAGLYALMSDSHAFHQIKLAVDEDLRFYKSRQGMTHG